MKKFLSLVVVSLLFVSPAKADSLNLGEVIAKVPALKQGMAYDLNDKKLSYLSTIEIAKYKGFALETGYSSNDKAVAVISYNVAKLKDFGVTLPVLDLVEFNLGYYVGYGRIQLNDGLDNGNNEFSHGPSLTLLNIKF